MQKVFKSMKKLLKNNYLFLVFFLILVLKEPLYKLFTIEGGVYNTTRCKFLEDDYNKLLEFSEIDLIYESDYYNSYVIYKDIYNYMNEITIRGGSDENLKQNPVIYDNTLVGIIDKVNKNSSIVKLITNKQSKISVKINEEIGVLRMKNGELIVENIANNSNIKVGDYIYTSGLGNIKENIYIGTVKEISSANKELEQIIKVDYKLNIKNIDFVTILKENK